MKRTLWMVIIMLMACMLVGCGEDAVQETPAVNEPVQEEVIVQEEVQEAEEAPVEELVEEAPSALEQAKAFVDAEISELKAVFGEPVSSHYEASCMGPGDDGILQYDEFTVYTYTENDVETVLEVEAP